MGEPATSSATLSINPVEELPESFPQCTLPNILHTGAGEPACSSAQLTINPVEGLPESFPQCSLPNV